MAITWGSYEGANPLRVGIDITVAGTTATVKYYVGTTGGGSYNDNQTMTYTGAITGSTNFLNNVDAGSSPKLVATKTKTVAPGSTYTFAAAISGAYNGVTPSHSRSYTAPIEVPGPVTSLSAAFINSGGAMIRWIQPSDWGGHDTDDYHLQYATNVGFTGATTITVLNTDDKVLSGLDPATTYWVRVRAWNSAGNGPYASAISFTTLAGTSGAPGPVTFSLIKPTTARASWTYPADDGGSPVTSYEIQYSLASDFSDPINAAGITSLLYNFTGLEPNTDYYVRVRAINAGGAGAWTASAMFTTLPGAKVMVGGVMTDVPTLIYSGGAFVPIAPQKRAGGVWVY